MVSYIEQRKEIASLIESFEAKSKKYGYRPAAADGFNNSPTQQIKSWKKLPLETEDLEIQKVYIERLKKFLERYPEH